MFVQKHTQNKAHLLVSNNVKWNVCPNLELILEKGTPTFYAITKRATYYVLLCQLHRTLLLEGTTCFLVESVEVELKLWFMLKRKENSIDYCKISKFSQKKEIFSPSSKYFPLQLVWEEVLSCSSKLYRVILDNVVHLFSTLWAIWTSKQNTSCDRPPYRFKFSSLWRITAHSSLLCWSRPHHSLPEVFWFKTTISISAVLQHLVTEVDEPMTILTLLIILSRLFCATNIFSCITCHINLFLSYRWSYGEWSQCEANDPLNATCGGGVQRRAVFCALKSTEVGFYLIYLKKS